MESREIRPKYKCPCRRVGIAGGIGSGKSVVSRILRCKGFRVYDCDSEASRLMHENADLRQRITEIIGPDAYGDDGLLNRALVASRLFGDPTVRQRVNEVVHKAVTDDFLLFSDGEDDVVFVESAILGSSGLAAVCHSVWMVDAPEATRVERVKLRSKLSEDDIKARMESQRKELDFIPPFKIKTLSNGDIDLLLPQILPLLQELTQSQKDG